MGISTNFSLKNDREIVIIDSGVEQYHQLIQGIKPGLDWVVLNSQQDGIEQITRILANTSNVKTLHIVSHGAPGCLFLGNTLLNLETLNDYAFQLKSWFYEPLTLDTFLLLYGCNVAAGKVGKNFITELHRLTRTDIAASQTLTGNAALNGDWDLDFIIGKIQPELAFELETQAAYVGVMGDVFISEYIEGSSYNKALELYNSSGESIDLAGEDYTIELYSNGSSTPKKTISLSGTLASGDVFVIAHPSANESILSVTDLQTNAVNFNGDDTIVLKKNGLVIDSFGQIGVDPGEEWISGEVGTQDQTLRRKSSILTGDSNPNDHFDPAIEWEVFPNNTLDGLGLYDATFDHTVPFNLVISEVMYDPNSSDENWEWIEVYNPHDVAVDLSGYVLDDENGTAHNTANIISGKIAANNTAILYDGNNTDFAIAWGSEINLIPVNDWSKMTLNNTGDKVSLWSNFLAYSGDHQNHTNTVDTVDYSGVNFPDPAGASIYLKDLTADNNDGNNWVVSVDRETTPNGTGFTDQVWGSIGSPGGNFAPNAADKTVTVFEDNSYTFQMSDFSFSDINSEDILQNIKITQLQTLGILKFDGVEVTQNQEINTSNLDKLTFTPADNNYGISYDRFQFQVSDGKTYSTANTITIDVTPVDDKPEVKNAITDITVDEDTADKIIDLSNVFTDIDNNDIEIIKTLKSNTNTELVQVHISDNILTLDFQENQNGVTEITIEAISNSKTITETFTVTVNAINDAPTNIILDHTQIAENYQGGIVGNLTAIDVDSSVFTYSVDDIRFEVVDNQLKLKAGEILDFETESTINLNITATDDGSPAASFTKSFSLSVEDIHEEELPVSDNKPNIEVEDEPDLPELKEPEVTPEEELPVSDNKPNIEDEPDLPELEEPEEELPVSDNKPNIEDEPDLPELEEPEEELPVADNQPNTEDEPDLPEPEEPEVIPEEELPVADNQPNIEVEEKPLIPQPEEPEVIPEEELPVADNQPNIEVEEKPLIPQPEEPEVIPEEELPVADNEQTVEVEPNIPELGEPEVIPEEELPVSDNKPHVEIEDDIPELEEPEVSPEEELPVSDNKPHVEIEDNIPELEEPEEELPVADNQPNIEDEPDLQELEEPEVSPEEELPIAEDEPTVEVEDKPLIPQPEEEFPVADDESLIKTEEDSEISTEEQEVQPQPKTQPVQLPVPPNIQISVKSIVQQSVSESTFDPTLLIPEITHNSDNQTLTHNILLNNTSNNLMMGSSQHDILIGNYSNDWINSYQGDDIINASSGDDTVYGGKGDDILFGFAGNNWLNGNEGADFIDGGEDADTIFGEEDADTLQGNAGDDWLSGNLGQDFINGGEGNDTIFAGQDHDTLQGDFGDDEIFGNVGFDLMEGNEGDDWLSGGEGNDTISGNDGNDTLNGDEGDDLLDGNAGNDLLNGGSGDDTLDGGTGNDILIGDRGDDWLFGAEGADILIGGVGRDKFVIGVGQGSDSILDFEMGEDIIILDGLTFEQLTIEQISSGTAIKFNEEIILILEEIESNLITSNDFMNGF